MRHAWWPGTARSRENANSIREPDVIHAIRQNVCAQTMMKSRISAHVVPIDPCQMYSTMYVNCFWTPTWLGIANVTASSRTKPAITETITAQTMPKAADRDALCVSSAMCADAS